MGLDDRDYMRNPGSQPGSSGERGGNGQGFSDVNTATQEELLLLPWMTERIADGIIERRERSPFLLTDELFEVRGIGSINIAMFRLYLYGFEDAQKPRVEVPVDIPDA
jgi:DNA uptake protein ComE-like DNA-binding protein